MLDKQIQPDEKLGKILEPEMVSVNEIIRKRMASENAPRIPEVTTHLIGAGGKRLRPMLTLAAARMFNYVGDKHLKLAATVEFIHTATLLHDDFKSFIPITNRQNPVRAHLHSFIQSLERFIIESIFCTL